MDSPMKPTRNRRQGWPCFSSTRPPPQVNLAMDVFFAIDIILNFFTGFYDKGTANFIFVLKKMALKY